MTRSKYAHKAKNAAVHLVARRVFLLLAVILILLLTGCVTVDVINLSELNARVLISLPDAPGGYTRQVSPGGSTSTFSNQGGQVTIQVLPDEKYRQLLNQLQDEITRRLWEERDSLTGADVSLLVSRLNDIDSQLEKIAEEGASCSVNAPEFSSVTAILNWDSAISNWSLSCSVASEE